MREKPQKRTPRQAPYPRRHSIAAGVETLPLAPQAPLTPGSSGQLQPALAPGQGGLQPLAQLDFDDLNIEALQVSFQTLGEPLDDPPSD